MKPDDAPLSLEQLNALRAEMGSRLVEFAKEVAERREIHEARI
jgi:hypothetical protein